MRKLNDYEIAISLVFYFATLLFIGFYFNYNKEVYKVIALMIGLVGTSFVINCVTNKEY